MNRSKNISRNAIFGFLNRFIALVFPFIIKTIIIHYIGVEYIGLNSLFNSVLNILNIAELGVSSAIVFNLYSAISNKDNKLICSLLNFYKKTYRVLGLVVLSIGLIIIPFLPYLIKGEVPNDINLKVLYLVYLCNTCLTYFAFSYKESILIANQRSDVSSNISSLILIVQYFAQAIVLIIFRNYYIYIVFLPISSLLINMMKAVYVNKKYPQYKAAGKLENETHERIIKRIKSLFLYKIGSAVLVSVDSIVISSFLGLTELGVYNNYYYIITTLFGFITILYTSMTASVGNSLNTESYEKNYLDFKKIYFMQAFLISWCTTCLLCLYQPFIEWWIGSQYLLPFPFVILLCLYFFVWRMMDAINLYKDAAGLWEYDKYRPLIASIFNLVLNLILVQFIGLYGIVISTIVSILIVIMPWSTFVLFKHLFNIDYKKEFFKLILKFLVVMLTTAFGTFITYSICLLIPTVSIKGIIFRFLICCFTPTIIYLFIYSFFSEYTITKDWILGKIKKISKGRKR